QELFDLLKGKLAHTVDPRELVRLNERVGRVLFQQLGNAEEAIPYFKSALELKCTVYQGLEDREAAVATMFEVADLWRGPANKPEGAGPALEKILEIDPANRTAYEQALALYSSVNDWRGYTTAMDRYLSNLVTDEEKVTALKELAQVQEQRLGQKDVAFLKLLRAVELAPADHELREQTERLAEETEGYDELATAYEHVADNVPRGPLAERLYLVLAKVQSEKLNDLSGAEASLRKILEFDPTNKITLDTLAQLFSGGGKD